MNMREFFHGDSVPLQTSVGTARKLLQQFLPSQLEVEAQSSSLNVCSQVMAIAVIKGTPTETADNK